VAEIAEQTRQPHRDDIAIEPLGRRRFGRRRQCGSFIRSCRTPTWR
jgi:hypothetical protein